MLLNFVIDGKDEYVEVCDNETLREALIKLCEKLGLCEDYYEVDDKLCDTDIDCETKIVAKISRKRHLWLLLKEKYEDFPDYDDGMIWMNAPRLANKLDHDDSRRLCELLSMIENGDYAIGEFFCEALGGDNSEIAKIALTYDMCINGRYNSDAYECTPLTLAVEKDNIEIVRELLSIGAKMDPEENTTERLMYYVIGNDNLDMIKILLSAFPRLINYYDGYGFPIVYAIEFDRWDIFMFLINNGADTRLCHLRGENTIEIAAKIDDPRYLEELSRRGLTDYCYCAISKALERGDYRACERLMDAHRRK